MSDELMVSLAELNGVAATLTRDELIAAISNLNHIAQRDFHIEYRTVDANGHGTTRGDKSPGHKHVGGRDGWWYYTGRAARVFHYYRETMQVRWASNWEDTTLDEIDIPEIQITYVAASPGDGHP